MKKLLTNIGNVYFYIENEVIFNISSYDNGDDCAKRGVSGSPSADETKIPSISVAKDEVTTNYFLTNFIEDGDTYKSNVFYKHPHADGSGNDVTIPQYYTYLCKEQMKSVIAEYPSKDFNFFDKNRKLFGIPLFMLSGSGYTVSGITPIPFTESDFNKYKEETAKEVAVKTANNALYNFGYEVNTLTIKTKQ